MVDNGEYKVDWKRLFWKGIDTDNGCKDNYGKNDCNDDGIDEIKTLTRIMKIKKISTGYEDEDHKVVNECHFHTNG